MMVLGFHVINQMQ